MRIKLTYIAPLLAAGAAAVAIAAAPTAAAEIGQTCSGNVCQSPGNVQVNNAPSAVQYHPYGDMPFSSRRPRWLSRRHGLTPLVVAAVGPPPRQDDGPTLFVKTG